MSIKQITVMLLLSLSCLIGFSQNQTPPKVYNPNADAKSELNAAIVLAKQTHKHVFVQIGGNWCSWCIQFHNFIQQNDTLSQFLNKNYVVVKINTSPENKNYELLESLGFPQRFGFPVFVILDESGNRIHTQSSEYLEANKTYDLNKVYKFLQHWTPAAIDPASYIKK